MFGMAKKTQQGSCLLVPLGRKYCKVMTMCGQLGRKEVFINYKSVPLGILVAAQLNAWFQVSGRPATCASSSVNEYKSLR